MKEGLIVHQEKIIVQQNIAAGIERLKKQKIKILDLFSYELDIYTGKGAVNISILGVFN